MIPWAFSRVLMGFFLPLMALSLVDPVRPAVIVPMWVALFGLPFLPLVHLVRHGSTRASADAALKASAIGPIHARVEGVAALGKTRYEVVVDALDVLPARVRLSRKLPLLSDLSTGDGAFDGVVRVEGDPVEALAVLDASAREGLVNLVDEHPEFTLEDGSLRARAGMFASRDAIVALGEKLTTVANLLGFTESPEARLIHIANTDPVPAVRDRALRTLLRERPEHPEVRAWGKALVAGDELATALLAADALGFADEADALRAQLEGHRGQLQIAAGGGGQLSPEAPKGALSATSEKTSAAAWRREDGRVPREPPGEEEDPCAK
jgi:hypothetical protein